MENQEARRVAVIGGGPRGTSVVERLIAQHRDLGPGAPALALHVIEPYEPGPGHVWQTGQSRLFLMNTPCLYPTVVPAGPAAADVAASPGGISFDAWRTRVNDGLVPGLGDDDLAECARLASRDFPSRALYGRYLAWIFAEVVRQAPDGVTVVHHRKEAVGLRRLEDAAEDDLQDDDEPWSAGGWRILLDDGSRLHADDVVLALGHLAATLTPEQERLQDVAARHGLQYWPPAVPADVAWARLPARKTVLVRGLGLNFFDAMIQLTEGRGGTFSPMDGGRLDYAPSGREPRIVAASRRGVPYRAKASLDTYIPRTVTLRFCTPARVLAFRQSGVQPGFDHDLWPLLHRDVLWAYYTTLCRPTGRAPAAPEAFLAGLDTALGLEGPAWEAAAGDAVARAVPADLRLDVEALAQPFARRRFADGEEYAAAVLAYLDADAAGSADGEDDPLKMAIGAMNAGRSVIKQAVADGGISDSSWNAELRGWFEPLVEGLASGPPPVRIAQLAALVRAGIVRFVGPNPSFGFDQDEGLFRATSPWVHGDSFTARYLVEAMMPANRVTTSLSPLMRTLLEDGTVRPRTLMGEDGVPVTAAGLDVTLPPYRAVDSTGTAQDDLFVIGLQLSSVQWGTAIAAEAGAPLEAGGRTLLDADLIAAALLERAAN
ncbi:FAD/NAD(P)-binding protein [Arthrobacter agilis]|uniref:FAD/NAD(P)-binding protein n=1 Tax=Arthrobacter agilis TaxID=37921 RepID=UPI002783DB3E|nr:FAD/NAD(P)-binding protein [Arthrobacter agilis]MDQ0737062.1 putative NAD(P)/FAD-binding protein YdhS [Arthrobacter agilis]